MRKGFGNSRPRERLLRLAFLTLRTETRSLPLIGGWILAATGSYYLLFAVAAAGPVGGLLLLRSLPEPRRAATALHQKDAGMRS